MELLLIRHTTPQIDKTLCYGQSDLDVSPLFDEELADIKSIIHSFTPDSIFTSPLMRCTKLASALFPNRQPIVDARLMELNFGDWENKAWAAINRQQLDEWSANFMNQSPPNGESFNDLVNRVASFETDMLTNDETHNKAIVTHSGVMRCFLMKHLHIPPEKIFNLQLNYAAVISIKYGLNGYSQVKILKG